MSCIVNTSVNFIQIPWSLTFLSNKIESSINRAEYFFRTFLRNSFFLNCWILSWSDELFCSLRILAVLYWKSAVFSKMVRFVFFNKNTSGVDFAFSTVPDCRKWAHYICLTTNLLIPPHLLQFQLADRPTNLLLVHYLTTCDHCVCCSCTLLP